MNKFLWILIVLLVLSAAVGCAGLSGDSAAEHDNGAAEENAGHADEQEPSEHPNDQTPENAFHWESLNNEDLSNGVLTSLEFQIGSKFDDIIAAWGIPKDEGYMRGGKYYHYEKEQYYMFFFDPEVSETVNHIQLNPKISIQLNDIRELLGTPDFDEHDDLSGHWVLGYHFEHYTLFVNSNADDPNSEVLYLFLKSEQE